MPNAYFAKLVNKEVSPEAKQNMSHQTAVTASTCKHEPPSNELTDEDLLTFTHNEKVSTPTTNDRQGRLPDMDQTQPALEQALCNSSRSISEEKSMVVDQVAEHKHGASTSNSVDRENGTQAPQQSTWISCMVSNAFTYSKILMWKENNEIINSN